MNEKQITKLIGASIFAVLFLWGVYVFSGYYSQWQEKKAQQEQHTREQMAEQYMSSYTEKLQKTLGEAGLEGVEVSYQYDKYSGSTPEYDEYGRKIEDDEDEDSAICDEDGDYPFPYSVEFTCVKLDEIYNENKSYKEVCNYMKPAYDILQTSQVERKFLNYKNDRNVVVYTNVSDKMDIKTKAGWYILTKEGDDEYILTDSKRQQLYADEAEEDDYDDADEYEDTDENDEDDSDASGGPVIKAGGRLMGESDSKDTSDSDNDTTSSKNTQKKKKYDPYDVYDYDDPDDFADEWAEEFGDGDYDNGYDDAYDYWEEKNR